MKIGISILIIAVVGAGIWWFARPDSATNQNTNQVVVNTTSNTDTGQPINGDANTNAADAMTQTETTLTNTSTVPENAPNLGQAPAFSLKDYSGATVTLEQYAGQPLVLNSWAAWCPYCVDELPDFAKVQAELDGRVTIIAINRAESLNTARNYTNNLGVTDDLVYLLDPSDSFYSSIGGFSMPETILVDGDGIIRHHIRGPINDEMLKSKLSEFLGIN